jgi:hypothetical protein
MDVAILTELVGETEQRSSPEHSIADRDHIAPTEPKASSFPFFSSSCAVLVNMSA